MSSLSTKRLAEASAHHPWRVLAGWLVAVVVASGLAGTLLSGALTTEFKVTNDPQSVLGDRLLTSELGRTRQLNEVMIVRSDTLTIDQPAFQKRVEQVREAITATGSGVVVLPIDTYYSNKADFLVSKDRHATIIPFTMAGTMDEIGRASCRERV